MDGARRREIRGNEAGSCGLPGGRRYKYARRRSLLPPHGATESARGQGGWDSGGDELSGLFYTSWEAKGRRGRGAAGGWLAGCVRPAGEMSKRGRGQTRKETTRLCCFVFVALHITVSGIIMIHKGFSLLFLEKCAGARLLAPSAATSGLVYSLRPATPSSSAIPPRPMAISPSASVGTVSGRDTRQRRRECHVHGKQRTWC